jgi:hypothetical protein
MARLETRLNGPVLGPNETGSIESIGANARDAQLRRGERYSGRAWTRGHQR